jgi:polyhydroxyalkanoate synthesis regulator phasin
MASMERGTKLKLVAGGVAAFVLAVTLGAGGALAAVGLFSDDDDDRVAVAATAERDDDEQGSGASLERALEFLVDEAVEAGRLSEEEGEELKERLESGDLLLGLPGLRGDLFGPRGPDFFGGLRELPFVRPALDLDLAADYLELTPSELRDELAEGKSLADVARAEGKSVDGLVQVLVGAAEERIDDAVADGRLSEERASELKADLEERIEERVDDELARFELPLHGLWRELDRELERFGEPS